MKIKNLFILAGLTLMLTVLLPAAPLWAGANEDPPTDCTVQGPELWGVWIIDCTKSLATLRVKRVVDCDVQTQAITVTPWTLGSCPADPSEVLWRKLGITLFGINPNPATLDSIVTKVKNFKQDDNDVNLVSMDVQIKFCQY